MRKSVLTIAALGAIGIALLSGGASGCPNSKATGPAPAVNQGPTEAPHTTKVGPSAHPGAHASLVPAPVNPKNQDDIDKAVAHGATEVCTDGFMVFNKNVPKHGTTPAKDACTVAGHGTNAEDIRNGIVEH